MARSSTLEIHRGSYALGTVARRVPCCAGMPIDRNHAGQENPKQVPIDHFLELVQGTSWPSWAFYVNWIFLIEVPLGLPAYRQRKL